MIDYFRPDLQLFKRITVAEQFDLLIVNFLVMVMTQIRVT
jgi:hypothetical protein